MATHDYIISNASGAAVRADLNNALAAIVSNNSNATSPATTYSFQFWADTTTGQLKIRNAANSAWITLMELDGTMLMEDGTVSAPGLAFASDLNTGFFRSAADKINFATGGAERLEIGSSEVVFNDPSNDVDFRVESNGNTHMLYVDAGNDRVGIGIEPTTHTLQIHEDSSSANFIHLTNTTTGSTSSDGTLIGLDGNESLLISQKENNYISVHTNNTERLRIDSSGRLLVGTSSARANFFNTSYTPRLQLESANSGANSSIALVSAGNGAFNEANLILAKSRGNAVGDNTIVQSGDDLGGINFQGSDGAEFVNAASIFAEVDGTPGSNDMPGRLVFNTTADGASSPTERMRITSNGVIQHQVFDRWMRSDGTTNCGFIGRADQVIAGGVTGNFGISTGGGDLIFAAGGTSESARIDSSGRLGIATSSPDAELHVGGSTPHIDIGPDDSNRCKIGYSGSDMHFGVSASAGNYHFKRNVTSTGNPADDGTVVAQILSGGRLKVTNTGGSGSAYHTNANFSGFHTDTGSNIILGLEHSHSSDPYGVAMNFSDAAPDNNSNYFLYCTDETAVRAIIYSDGDIQNHDNSYSAISDVKLKQDIVDAGSQWEDLKNLRVRKFKFKSDVAAYGDDAKTLIGLVAQEAETVSPGLVADNPDKDSANNDLGTVTKSVRYSVLYMKAIKALQEAMDRIETLEAKVAALEAG
jgi:hypothetical protein